MRTAYAVRDLGDGQFVPKKVLSETYVHLNEVPYK